MASMLANLAEGVAGLPGAPPLLAGTGKDEVHLLIVATADRLAGGFNSSIGKGPALIQEQTGNGKQVKLVTVGRKGRDMLRRDNRDKLIEHFDGIVGKRRMQFADVRPIADRLLETCTRPASSTSPRSSTTSSSRR